MDLSYFLVQSLNSVQYGFLLFLVASGLTLIFGILGVVNLAHGSFHMIGAYLAYWLALKTGNWRSTTVGIPQRRQGELAAAITETTGGTP